MALTDRLRGPDGRLLPDPPASRRRVRRDGYVDVWAPAHPLARRDGYVMEHRKIAFDAGMPVGRQSHIHHRNGIKTDNCLENLCVLDIVEHAQVHAANAGVVINQFGIWPIGDPELPVKTCRQCGQTLARTEFSLNRRAKDERFSHCKECERKRLREYAARTRRP